MITPLDNTIKNIMSFTWPMVIISVLIISSLRIAHIIKNNEKFIFYKEVFSLLFLVYILCLFQIVTFEDTSIYIDGNNIIPFKEILRYEIGSRLFFKNVIGNIVLFIPYGLFATSYTKIDRAFHILCLVLFASITVEVTQLIIGRVFDIDDIILNLIGGFIGYCICITGSTIGEKVPSIFKRTWFLNLMSILLLSLLVGYIWMVVR